MSTSCYQATTCIKASIEASDYENGKAVEVRSRLAADFTGWETNNTVFESQLERLIRALRADEGGRETPPPSRL
jgi:hypothetical protein